MVKKRGLKPPRVVVDTNCVVSALLFTQGRLEWLRQGWHVGQFTPLVNRDTVTELIRGFNYPKFKLNRDEQETLLADFLPYAETVRISTNPPETPELRDPDDSKFLILAKTAQADALISGDADILGVRGQFNEVAIMTATEFFNWLPNL